MNDIHAWMPIFCPIPMVTDLFIILLMSSLSMQSGCCGPKFPEIHFFFIRFCKKWQEESEAITEIYLGSFGRLHIRCLHINDLFQQKGLQRRHLLPWRGRIGRVLLALCAWNFHTMLYSSFVHLMTRAVAPTCVQPAAVFLTVLNNSRRHMLKQLHWWEVGSMICLHGRNAR